jgi:hypothetical protein
MKDLPVGKTAPTAVPTSLPGDTRFEARCTALLDLLVSRDPIADVAREIMAVERFSANPADGRPYDRDWFPLEQNLKILRAIGQRLGDAALFKIGFSVPQKAAFPTNIRDVPQALAGLDVAFHMNHRRSGTVMYDPLVGEMLDGIGHYRSQPLDGRNVATTSTGPYPCEFDRGVVAGVAGRFERASRVVHDDRAPCRKSGADSCTYIVTW